MRRLAPAFIGLLAIACTEPQTVTIQGPESESVTYVLPQEFQNDDVLIAPATAPKEGEVLKTRLALESEIPRTCLACKVGSTWVGYWGRP